jgi:ribonuclease HII
LCVNFKIERELLELGYKKIAGIDEVGRGCLFGPVVAAAVILDHTVQPIEGIDDSKKISKRKRERLARIIFEKASGVGIGFASNIEIDAVNIQSATFKAMKRAIENLPVEPDFLLIDGRTFKNEDISYPCRVIIGGDRKCISIAAASIIAKVVRDELMEIYSNLFPGFFINKNKGYGTKEHFLALKDLGCTLFHRVSFNLKW